MFLVSLCQIKPISGLYNRCVKYALSLAMLSVHHRQKKVKTHSQGALLSNEVHLQTLHITTILDTPSATVRCTLKTFLRLHFLRCISTFLFTLQLLRDCDKKHLTKPSSASRV